MASSGSSRSRRVSVKAAIAAVSEDSPSTPSYKLRKRNAVSYEDPAVTPPEESSPRRKSVKQARVATPKSVRGNRKPSVSFDEEGFKTEEACSGNASAEEMEVDRVKAKEETPKKMLKILLKKAGSTPTSGQNGLVSGKLSRLDEIKESSELCIGGSDSPKRSLRSGSRNGSPNCKNSPLALRDCKVALIREQLESPKTPRTPVHAKGTASPNVLKTPVRSSSRMNTSVVRKLEDSLNEASPATPASSSRSLRSKAKVANYAYFDCDSSGSDFEGGEQSDSSDADTENNLSGEDEVGGILDESPIRNHKCVTPLKSKYLENPSLALTPKIVDAISRTKNKDFSPRRTPNIKNVKNTPKSESYFTAEKRLKFSTPKSIRKADELRAKREGKTPKRPRKGNRQGIDKISARAPPAAPNFSITKESAKIPFDVEFEIPWVTEHADVIEELHDEIISDFSHWLILLREGFNIMLHGYGSKQFVFDAFNKFLDDKYSNIIINGLFTKFNARKFVLDFIDSLDLKSEVRIMPSSVYSMTEELLEKTGHLAHPPVFIFVMNCDVLGARHGQMLAAIAGLARIPFVHVIASCDHVNAGLGIPPLENIRLNFTWMDCTTYENYHKELVWNSNIFGNANDINSAESSIEHIFKSLTTNAKKAFGILAGLQLKKLKVKKKSTGFQGVEFRELLRLCRESFVAHSESTLKALLTEFVDHKLLRYTGKGKNDDNFLIIDLDETTLEKYAGN